MLPKLPRHVGPLHSLIRVYIKIFRRRISTYTPETKKLTRYSMEFVGKIGPVWLKSKEELPGYFRQLAYAQKDSGPYDWFFKPIFDGVENEHSREKLDRPNNPS